MIEIFTDGSSHGSVGPGGWAAIIIEGGQRRVRSGNESETTNNRMDLTAAIRGLEETPEGTTVTVLSDSQYLVNTVTRDSKRKANQDLWAVLNRLISQREIRWELAQADSVSPEKEEANAIAGREADKLLNVSIHDGSVPMLTHLDWRGRAQMVDVGHKEVTQREAVAKGFVSMKPSTVAQITAHNVDKGDVLAAARLAGIMGAKLTSNLIPLCHPIPLNQVTVELEPVPDQSGIRVKATARTDAKTGVEMEALTAVSVAALTIYDMCKSLDRDMRIQSIRLIAKRGGKSGDISLED